MCLFVSELIHVCIFIFPTTAFTRKCMLLLSFKMSQLKICKKNLYCNYTALFFSYQDYLSLLRYIKISSIAATVLVTDDIILGVINEIKTKICKDFTFANLRPRGTSCKCIFLRKFKKNPSYTTLLDKSFVKQGRKS